MSCACDDYRTYLFDVESDPAETTDLMAARPDVAAALLGKLKAALARLRPERVPETLVETDAAVAAATAASVSTSVSGTRSGRSRASAALSLPSNAAATSGRAAMRSVVSAGSLSTSKRYVR